MQQRVTREGRSLEIDRNIMHAGAHPTAAGALTQLVYVQARAAGVDVGPILKTTHLILTQIRDPGARLGVRDQINFLNRVVIDLQDDFSRIPSGPQSRSPGGRMALLHRGGRPFRAGPGGCVPQLPGPVPKASILGALGQITCASSGHRPPAKNTAGPRWWVWYRPYGRLQVSRLRQTSGLRSGRRNFEGVCFSVVRLLSTDPLHSDGNGGRLP
jgi:hypothetical protein